MIQTYWMWFCFMNNEFRNFYYFFFEDVIIIVDNENYVRTGIFLFLIIYYTRWCHRLGTPTAYSTAVGPFVSYVKLDGVLYAQCNAYV